MSDHADTIRRCWTGGVPLSKGIKALDALLAERQQAIDAAKEVRQMTEQRQQAIDALREKDELIAVYRAAAQLARRQESTLRLIRECIARDDIFAVEKIELIDARLERSRAAAMESAIRSGGR